MPTRDEIARQALALSPDDRAYVADIIEQSLTSGEFATKEIAHAWDAEITRRLEAYDRGEVQALDAVAAIERIRQYLVDRRTTRTNS